MEPFLKERFFNPSAGYGCARHVREAVEEARAAVAALLGAFPSEIVFTSGGTEASNMAFRQMAGEREGGIGVLSTDHDASLKTALALGSGCVCPVDREGRAVPEKWESMCAGGVSGVSFAWANNETGALQDAAVLCSSAGKHGVPVHLDIVQCAGKIPVDLHGMEVDYASVSAHKFHGPKGIGFLYIRKGLEVSPYLLGGSQEKNLRAGTENVASIVGMAVALRKNCDNLQSNMIYLSGLEERLISKLDQSGTNYVLNGSTNRLPGLMSLSFEGQDGEAILHKMDLMKIAISTGSACDSKRTEISHVLRAIGLKESLAKGTIRVSLCKNNTLDEVDTIVNALIKVIQK